MAINTTRLATGLGKIFGGANEINTYRGTTIPARVTSLISQLGTATNDTLTGIYSARDAAKASEGGLMSYYQSLVSALIIAEVNLDRNIPNDSIADALAEWKRQMLIAADSFNVSLVNLTVAAVGSPTGSSYAFAVTDYDSTGVQQDMIVPDVYLIQTTADKDHGGTRWAETMSVVGKQADSAATDDTYPTGTGLNTTVTVHDPAAGTGLVTDPSFNLWTTNTPQKWTLGTGTLAGTHVFQQADDPRDGAAGKCLKLVGDGVVIPKVHQTIVASANDVLAVHFRVKLSLDPGLDWKVGVRLTDSTGAALAGPNSYSNLVSSLASTSVPGDWTAAALKGYFILPNNLPADGVVNLEVLLYDAAGGVGTAPVNTAAAFVDFVDVVAANYLYPGGPALTVFSGTTNSVDNDAWTLTIALASGTASNHMIRWLDRMLDLKGLGIRMPTSNTPTQADALIS